MLRRLYDAVYGLVRVVVIVLLVVLALYVSLGRHYVSYIAQYRDEAVSRFNEATGIHLQAGELKGSWSGLSPVVEILDFSIAATPDDKVAISATRVEIELDVIASLLTRVPQIRHSDLDGLVLHLQQSATSQWSLAGFVPGGGELPVWLADALLGIRVADVRDARLALIFKNGNATELSLPTARFAGDGDFRRLVLEVALADSGPIHLIAEAAGDPRDLEDFTTSVYMQLDDAWFGAFRGMLPERYGPLLDTRASGQLWVSRDERKRIRVSGDIDAPSFAVGAFWQRPDQVVRDTQSTFSAVYDAENWLVWFDDAGLTWDNDRLQLSNFQLSGSIDAPEVRAYMPDVKVEQLLGMLRDGPIPGSLDTLLEELSPRGRLRNVVVLAEPGSDSFDSLRVSAELNDVALQAWRGAPGATGINGWVEAGTRSGRVLLDTPALSLNFPKLYDAPLNLQRTRAEVIWQLTDERVRVESGVIESAVDGSGVGGLLSLDLPVSKDSGPPLMTLSIGLEDADISARNAFIPKTLSKNLLNWLDKSIGGGHVDRAGFVYRGSARAGDSAERTVQLFVDVRDATLRFHEDWPAVNSVAATLLLDDGTVRTYDASARMFEGVAINNLDVGVDGAGSDTRLSVKGSAVGSVQQLLRVYRNSMLEETTGGVFSSWAGTGDIDLKLALDLPLSSGGRESDIDVQARLSGNRIELGGLNLALGGMRGDIRYRNNVISSRNLRGDLFNKPITIDIEQQRGGPIVTTARGSVAMQSIESWLEQPVFALLGGEAAMEATITAGGEQANIVVRSDLVGATFDVPQPFTKRAEAPRRLRLEMPLRGERRTMRTEIQGLGNIAVMFSGSQTQGVAVTLGHSDQLAVGHTAAVTVSGAIDRTALMPWQDVLDRYLAAAARHEARQPGGSNARDPWMVRVENFGIGALDVGGVVLEELVINAVSPREPGEHWEVDAAGPALVGRIKLPRSDGEPLDIKLQRLILPAGLLADDDGADPSAAPADDTRLSPGSLPAADVYIGQLRIADQSWGSIGFQLRPVEDAAVLRNIRGNIRGALLSNGDMVWSGAGPGRAESTQFTGNFTLPSLGDTLQAFGYERVIEAKNARSDVSLKWTGGPDQFDLIGSEGFFGIATDRGRLPSTPDTATGALRIVGIFNLSNLIRRMQFDFSDLFEKGVAFDSIKGRVALARGVMSLPGPIEIKGPSSRFVLTGNVDFNTDETDMQLVATLPVASNLPWVAALVGGLPAAAGVYVASKLFEKQVDKFSSAIYEISGSWQDPKLKFKRVFDDDAPDAKAAPPAQRDATAQRGGGDG